MFLQEQIKGIIISAQHLPTKKFSKVSGLVYLLYQVVQILGGAGDAGHRAAPGARETFDPKSPRCADTDVISIPHCVAVHLLPCKRTGSRQREMRLRVKRRGVGRESNSKCLGRELQRSRIGDRRSRRRVVKARLHLGHAIGAGPRTLPRPPPRSTETPPSLGVSVWQSLTVLTRMVRSAIGCLRRSKLLMTPYTISLHIHTWTRPSGSH